MKDQLKSLIRHALTMAGGILVHKGWVSVEDLDAASSGLAQVGAGVGMWALAQAMSFINLAKFKELIS